MQEYMGDEDGVDQVKEEDNGIVALGRAPDTHLHERCKIASVKSRRKGKASSLVEVGHASTSVGHAWRVCIGVWWFRP
jgi:hypothetical protein